MKKISFVRRAGCLPLFMALLALSLFSVSGAKAIEISGVQPYALDHPRVPAYLTPPGEADQPVGAYSELRGRKQYAFDCFLDTAASRIVLGKRQQKQLGVKTTGKTVDDIGIGGTETFDVSAPYILHVGDTRTPKGNLKQYPFSMRVVMEVKQKETRMTDVLPKGILDGMGGDLLGGGSMGGLARELIPSLNIIGTPFLVDHIAVLDPRPVADAYEMLSGLMGGNSSGSMPDLNKLLSMLGSAEGGGGQFGRIRVNLADKDNAYPEPPIIVPLHLTDMESGRVPVTNAPIPMVKNAVLVKGDHTVKTDLALDTGGAVSLITSSLARKMGLDLDSPDLKTLVMGVGKGNTRLKGYWLDRLTIRTGTGDPVIYERAPFFVADIPGIQGTIGANLLVPSVYIDMEQFLDSAAQGTDPLMRSMQLFSGMKPGPTPFRKVIIDLPNARLGLVPF
jgi:hypothetical protein